MEGSPQPATLHRGECCCEHGRPCSDDRVVSLMLVLRTSIACTHCSLYSPLSLLVVDMTCYLKAPWDSRTTGRLSRCVLETGGVVVVG